MNQTAKIAEQIIAVENQGLGLSNFLSHLRETFLQTSLSYPLFSTEFKRSAAVKIMQLEEHDYKQIELFRDRQRYSPNERLLKYRRNLISLGGLILLIISAGIPISNLKILSSAGIVGGDIARPYFIFVFLTVFFGYNFIMFSLYLKKEISALTFYQMSFNSFCHGVAKYKLTQLLSSTVFQSPRAETEKYLDDIISCPGNQDKQIIKFSVGLLPETIIKYREKIEGMPEFTLPEPGKGGLIFEYMPTEQDRKFYDENKDYLKTIFLHEFMDFEFPKYFGLIVLLAIFFHYRVSLYNLINIGASIFKSLL